jgi:hypothetical protein
VVFHFDTARGQTCPKETRGSATPCKIHGDNAERKYRNEGKNGGRRHPRFPLITFRIYNVFWYNNLVLHFDTAIQSQYISLQAHTIQIGWSRAAPACREHFGGGVPK